MTSFLWTRRGSLSIPGVGLPKWISTEFQFRLNYVYHRIVWNQRNFAQTEIVLSCKCWLCWICHLQTIANIFSTDLEFDGIIINRTSAKCRNFPLLLCLHTLHDNILWDNAMHWEHADILMRYHGRWPGCFNSPWVNSFQIIKKKFLTVKINHDNHPKQTMSCYHHFDHGCMSTHIIYIGILYQNILYVKRRHNSSPSWICHHLKFRWTSQ